MNRCLLASLACLLPGLVHAQVIKAPTPNTDPLHGLELGTRMTYVRLLDEKQHYIGHLGELSVDQDYAPTRVFADYFFSDQWGVELTWDQISADAVNTDLEHESDADGTLELSGPILTAVRRFQLDNGCVPYVGAGLTWLNGNFDTATWWADGYSSKADWIDLGRPHDKRNGKSRTLSVDDTLGYVLTGGADCALTENWDVGLYGRLMFAESDAHVKDRLGHHVVQHTEGSFTSDNLALGLTLRYRFL